MNKSQSPLFLLKPSAITAKILFAPAGCTTLNMNCGNELSRASRTVIGVNGKKAAEGRRTPKRKAFTCDSQITRSVMECASPLALSHRTAAGGADFQTKLAK